MNKVITVEKAMLPRIAEIQKRIYAHFLDNEPWTDKTALAFIKYNYKLQPDLFFVLLRGEEIAGYTFGRIKPWADGNHLICEELLIDFAHQGKGLSKHLGLKLVEEAVSKYNITTVEATTFDSYDGNPMKTYKKLGFKKQHYFLIEAKAQKLLKTLKGYQ
jgi:GNAT superfamily N-acetyltransferase